VSTVYAGQVVVRRGDIVTPSVMQQLTALGLQSRHTSVQDVEGAVLFAILIVAVLFWYLGAFYPSTLHNPRFLILIDATVMFGVVGARLMGDNHVLLPYFLPIAAASTFSAALMLPEACVAITFAAAVLAGWIVANSFELTLFYFLTGTAGILSIRRVQHLRQFIWAGCCTFAAAFITLIAFGLVDRVSDPSAVEGYLLASAFNGFVSSALALGAFAVISGFFGVTTGLQLLELSQPSQPVLRRLMVQAPGTYNHSLILASMVEHAAEEIGANSLAAKVGAMYHDIGKSVNPYCFVENQLGMANVHDDMPAVESARIIRGHVTAGLRIARQHRLPGIIRHAIAEHHGTMTIAFFLSKAQREAPGIPIDQSLFRYAGPKPQSKETALLMLADACESAVRASGDHSASTITEVVNRMFGERIASGQLDECPLTLHDIERAKSAYCAVLNGLYHPRIEYPESSSLVVERTPERHTTNVVPG
jgi:putative nucleotidyltransferase with HDIG domain